MFGFLVSALSPVFASASTLGFKVRVKGLGLRVEGVHMEKAIKTKQHEQQHQKHPKSNSLCGTRFGQAHTSATQSISCGSILDSPRTLRYNVEPPTADRNEGD